MLLNLVTECFQLTLAVAKIIHGGEPEEIIRRKKKKKIWKAARKVHMHVSASLWLRHESAASGIFVTLSSFAVLPRSNLSLSREGLAWALPGLGSLAPLSTTVARTETFTPRPSAWATAWHRGLPIWHYGKTKNKLSVWEDESSSGEGWQWWLYTI